MICKTAKEETYEDVEKLLYKLCHTIKCCDQCRFEDRLSTANEAFAVAYNSYDASKGASFSTWVYWQVRCALLSRKGNCIQQSRRFKNGLKKLPDTRKFGFVNLISELSDDAGIVIKIVSEAPEELVELWVGSSDSQGMLRSYLMALNWSLVRISNVFSEIREVVV